MSGRALTPDTRRSLGKPLPHQQADGNRAAPGPINLYQTTFAAGTIRHYSRFREAIPESGVRSLSLLTRLPLTLAGSLDLHVLGTPPAFILSQDQTLHNRVESVALLKKVSN